MQHGFEFVGVRNGWRGLIDGNHFRLNLQSVSGILHLGGTILGTSRTNTFKREGGVDALFLTI
jgi:6-phosphofructokinase 1